jgi:hypothetical protein
MEDWINKLDKFLEFNDYEVFNPYSNLYPYLCPPQKIDCGYIMQLDNTKNMQIK